MLLGSFDIGQFCSKTSEILQFIGYIVTVIKIAIPVVIVMFGVIDFGKAVIAAKDDKMKESAKTVGRRLLAGVIIFFIPSIILWVFGAVSGYREISDNESGWKVCETCVLSPWKCKVGK